MYNYQLVSMVEGTVQSFNQVFNQDIKFYNSDDLVRDTDVIELEVRDGELKSVTVFKSTIEYSEEYHERHFYLATIIDQIVESILAGYFDEERFENAKVIYEIYCDNRDKFNLSIVDGVLDNDKYGMKFCELSTNKQGRITDLRFSSNLCTCSLSNLATKLAWSFI